jgi:dihydroorotase
MLLYSQVHGEVTNPDVDIFDREKVFIETVLEPLVQKLPQLKVVMEHITTMDAVRFVESSKEGKAWLFKAVLGPTSFYPYFRWANFLLQELMTTTIF